MSSLYVILLLVGPGVAGYPAPSPGAAADSTAPTGSASGSAVLGPAAADSLPMRLTRVGVLGATGGVERRLVEPSGVAVDAFGRVFVSDAGQHRVQLYDADGQWLTGAGSLGSDPGQFRRPGAVAALGHFGFSVLDRENRRVVSYDLHGRLVGTLIDLTDPSLTDGTGRIDPVTLAADRGGAVYVADADRDRLLVFDFSGRYLRSVGGYGSRAGSFRGLSGVATGPHGELAAADRGNRRVQRLEPGGRVLSAWPLPARAGEPARGRGALAVAVDDSGRVAVADEPAGRVWVFDPSGRLLATTSGLSAPRALAFAPDGTLLVAEAGAGRLGRYALRPPPSQPPAGAAGDHGAGR